MPESLGQRLLNLCATASESVVLIAPFIKAPAFARVLEAIPAGVPLTSVTRWRPDEVAAGVSDLEVLDQVRARPGSRLFLQPHLHAKLYRVGSKCLVGSANVTGRALGWTEPANLEILTELDASTPDIQALETQLFGSVIEADEQIRQAVALVAATLSSMMSKAPPWQLQEVHGGVFLMDNWLPTCPRPDLLYRVYDGTIGDVLLANSRALGENDLSFIEPPMGLSEAPFNSYVAAMLRQVKWIQDLDRLTNQGLTDHMATDTIRENLPLGHDFSPESLWSVTKDWLMYFFPDQYDRVPAGEMLRKRRRSI